MHISDASQLGLVGSSSVLRLAVGTTGMTQLQDLKSLNKSSARIATFAAKLCDGTVEKYTYFQKKSQQEVTAHKFEVTLVGSNPQEYCKGFVKASQEDCEKAAAKFKDGTVWALSKVAFDTYTAGQYISTPVLYRVDLSKSIMTSRDTNSDADKALRASMPPAPVPPTSVGDLTRITTNRSTDLIAVVKEVGNQTRRSKADELIVDVLLVDGTMASSGNLATIDVSVFGASKIDKLKAAVGTPMAFFNLSISCEKRGEKPKLTHYSKDKIAPAPECQKTAELHQKAGDLTSATNTETLTQVWVPKETRDVSGPQTLSCAAFLDYTTETPEANVPDVSQLMFVHIEEPAPEENILSGDRVWLVTQLRDNSGPVSVGIPQRCALELAKVPDKDTFTQKHAAGELNFPLLCHARISRTKREAEAKGGASQPVGTGSASGKIYVNHTLEAVEPVSWDPSSAPNAAYTDVLAILNNCPQNDEGIVFAYLADVQPDPFCGMHISFDDAPGPKGVYAAVLVACNTKSKTDPIGDNGYKVVTASAKDIANPAGNPSAPVGDHTLVGYCNMDTLPGFRLDPPRGKQFRVALVLITKADEEGFHIHKLEYIEQDQVNHAIACMQRLRRLNKQIHPAGTEKRSHNLTLTATGIKKARTLQSVPTNMSLPDDSSDNARRS